MNHKHSHIDDLHLSARRRLLIAIALGLSYMVIEFIGGLISGSLTLMADAGHMLIHSGALFIAYTAAHIAARTPTDKFAYGYGKIEPLGGLINGILLTGVGVFLAWEALHRLEGHHHGVDAHTMGGIALLGLCIHALAAWVLYRGRKDNLNVFAAFLHLLVDVLATIVAIITAVAIHFTHLEWLDSAATLLIVMFILFSAGNIMRRAAWQLLDRTPDNLSVADIRAALLALEHVNGVHHIYIRPVDARTLHLSAHLVMDSACMDAHHWHVCRKQAEALLREQFGIAHSVLQIEPEDPPEAPAT